MIIIIIICSISSSIHILHYILYNTILFSMVVYSMMHAFQ